MKKVKVKAYAKINLTLEIVGQEGGYHLLDSLVATVDLYDVITLSARKDALSSITMKGLGSESIPPERNNALKGAELFSKTFGVNGVDITVYKNIPIGAGLGGSSADVAGVLLGMAKLYKITDSIKIAELADTLGSDTKYMLRGGFARMQGRGTDVENVPLASELYFLAICPGEGVSTASCYNEYDKTPVQGAPMQTENCIRFLAQRDLENAGRCLTNHLFVPACRLNSDIEKAYGEALSFSPLGAVMTGSGSCVLALFETKELCEWAQSRYRGKFRTFILKTVNPEKQKQIKNPYLL